MIYVASSWRNRYQPDVVQALVAAGHAVYDFRKDGFGWSSIDPNWKQWTRPAYAEALKHPLAEKGFKRDRDALMQADTCVLVLPAGRSAHLEAGCFVNKRLVIYMPEEQEPELMYKLADKIVFSMEELVACLSTTPEKCSKTGCTNTVTHWQQIRGGVFRLCDEHYHAMLQTTWCHVEDGFPCSEIGCQEMATRWFHFRGEIRHLCTGHYNAKFKSLELLDGEITLRDSRPTEKINLSVEIP
jgi:hypothetical protein